MCCCGKPTINGQPGAYSWDGKTFSTRQPSPPDIQQGDVLLCDEPGRCGGLDSHSHHFRFVKSRSSGYALLVRHGGGDERISLWDHCAGLCNALAALDSNGRYWLLHSVYGLQRDSARAARDQSDAAWRNAAAHKRIKTRKYPAKGTIKVWIEPQSKQVETLAGE
jgi:hypothetical protein